MKYIFILFFALATFAACSESEQLMFDEPASVYFCDRQFGGDVLSTYKRDSVVFSFFGLPEDFTEAQAEMRFQITGKMVNYERELKLSVNPESTISTEDIIIADRIIVPANKLEVVVPIKFKRISKLKDGIYWIGFLIEDSTDLKKGYYDRLSYRFFMTDMAIKPSNWNQSAYGDYSIAKHKFILSIIPDIDWGAYPGVYIAYNARLRQALTMYEKQHGPLYGLAEDGEENIRVTFPS